MASKKSKKSKLPKTEQTAQRISGEQAKLNQQFGQVNEVTPFGSSQYVTGPDGRVTRTTTLSPSEQAKLDQANALDTSIQGVAQGLTGQAARAYASPFEANPTDVTTRRRQVEDQTFKAYENRLRPYWERQRQQQEAQLANRGIAPGGRGYANAMGDFTTQQNDAYLQAQTAANQAGRSEADTLFNQRLQSYQLPAQMIGSLRGSVSGVNTPNFLQPNLNAPDYLGAATALYGQANQKAIAGMAASGGGGESSSTPVSGFTTVAGITNPNQKTAQTKGLVGLGRLSAGY